MVYCPSCQAQVSAGAVQCASCGWSFSSASVSRSLTTAVRPAARPSCVCRNVHQLVVGVMDDSGSMAGQKGQEAAVAIDELLGELARPENKSAFFGGVIHFGSSATLIHPPDRVATLAGRARPVLGSGGGTNIKAALERALEVVSAPPPFVEGRSQWLRPVVILASDGCHNEGADPAPVAGQLKQVADIVCVAFGSDADEGLLQVLATSPAHFYRCSNGRELRKFLASVGKTLSVSISRSSNSTHALATIRQ